MTSAPERELPKSVPVPASNGDASMWRLADGMWNSGRGADIQQESAFLGYFRACRIHDDTTEENQQYQNLELDLEVQGGRIVTLKTTLKSTDSGKPTYLSSIALAHFITKTAPGQLVQLAAKAGGAMKRYAGKTVTFLNCYHVDDNTLMATEVRAPKSDGTNEWYEGTLRPLLREVANHPAYAARLTRAERKAAKDAANDPYADEPAPRTASAAPAPATAPTATLNELNAALAGGGWPSLDNGARGYVEMANAIDKAMGGAGQFQQLNMVPAEVLGTILKGYRAWQQGGSTVVPKLLQPYAPVANDPFA